MTIRTLHIFTALTALITTLILPGEMLATAAAEPACTAGQREKIRTGFDIAPVPLDLQGKNKKLVGLGSYIVNAQGACTDCHTNPPYAPGGDPFKGEPEQENIEGYLAGGRMFGPFISRNLTACQDGKPAGLNFEEFLQVMHTGVDLKDDLLPPGDTPTPKDRRSTTWRFQNSARRR